MSILTSVNVCTVRCDIRTPAAPIDVPAQFLARPDLARSPANVSKVGSMVALLALVHPTFHPLAVVLLEPHLLEEMHVLLQCGPLL